MAFDSSNYVAPSAGGYTSVVNGVPNQYATQAEAENDFNRRTGAGGGGGGGGGGKSTAQKRAELVTASGQGSASSWNTASDADVEAEYARVSGGGGGVGGGGGTVGANPKDLDAARALADQDAYRAYLNARLALDREQGIMRDEREKERIALEAARDAWTKTYNTATLSGYMPNVAQGKGQAVMDAIGQLRANPAYQQADGMTKRQMEAAAVAQATGIDTASAAQAIERLRALTATTGQPSSAALVEQVLGQTPGGAPATLEREREQNRAAIDALTLLSQLRGPENAFAYANTLQNLPESIRQNIQVSMGRLPFTAQNPAQRGVLGDVGVSAFGQGQMLPALTGPRTAMGYLPAPGAVQQGQPAPGSLMAQGWTTGPNGQEMMRSPAGQAAGDAATAADRTATAGQTGGGLERMPTYGPRTQPAYGGMIAPNQISPTDWNRTSPYAQKLVVAGYENAGEDPEHVRWLYSRSLPTAVGPRTGTYRAA